MWIKVEDREPFEGQDVIYYFEHVGVHRGKFTKTIYEVEHFGTDEHGNPYEGLCFYSDRGWLTDDVTHWMPDDGQELPPPPA